MIKTAAFHQLQQYYFIQVKLLVIFIFFLSGRPNLVFYPVFINCYIKKKCLRYLADLHQVIGSDTLCSNEAMFICADKNDIPIV